MPRYRFVSYLAASGLALLLAMNAAAAQDPLQIELTLKDHHYDPSEIHVPANTAVVINLHNTDPTAEEFDSSALTIEKVIAGGRSGIVRIRPLDKGRYPFIGEYHSDTAQGVIVVE